MRAVAFVCLGMLAACAQPVEMSIEERAEQTAAAAIEQLFPGTDPAPIANCVRDLATFDELLALSNGSADDPGEDLVGMVDDVLKREDVADCITFNNILLGG